MPGSPRRAWARGRDPATGDARRGHSAAALTVSLARVRDLMVIRDMHEAGTLGGGASGQHASGSIERRIAGHKGERWFAAGRRGRGVGFAGRLA